MNAKGLKNMNSETVQRTKSELTT